MGRKDQKLSLHSFKFRIIAMHKKTDMWHVFSGCYFDDIRVLHIFPALLFGIHLLGLVTTYLSYHLSILDQQSELLYSTQFLAVTNFRLTILPQIWTSSRKSPENHPNITPKSPGKSHHRQVSHSPKSSSSVPASPDSTMSSPGIECEQMGIRWCEMRTLPIMGIPLDTIGV